jgi:hypothetical protein
VITSFRIPTLADVLAEQRDLDRLCRDRALDTPEICVFNAYYGMDTVLKLYAAWPLGRPLKLALTHGIQLHQDFVWEAEIGAPVPAMLVYPEHLVAPYRAKTRKATFRTAAPYLYAARLLEPQPRPARQGTLFFLSHSSHWVTTRSDLDGILRRLAELPSDFQPITVCIYWRDHQLGRHEAFTERGFKIVSAGHIYDRAFLFRLHHLISMHKYACGNDLGSHLFYSIKSGASYFHLDGFRHVATYRDESGEETPDDLHVPTALRERVEAMFSSPAPQISHERMQFVDAYTGADLLMSPPELRAFLAFCERLDRIGVASWKGERYARWPQALRRTLWLALRRMAGRVARKVLPAAARRIVGMRS